MFHNYHIILFITRGVLHIVTIRKGQNQIVKTVKSVWSSQTLPNIFSQIKASYGSQPVRILLADELSYLLELPIPPSVSSIQERSYIQEQLATHIPEVLHSHDWDFKEVFLKGKEKKVLVFAPVKLVYDALLKASQVSGIEIEAIEPIVLASKRHKNPVIGLALKKDLKGKDEQVLNVLPVPDDEVDASSPEDEESKKSSGFLMIVLVAIIILVPAGGAWFYFQKNPAKTAKETQATTPSPQVVAPTETPPTVTETPTPEPFDVSLLKVQVLNGTGQPGLSSQIQGRLIEKGFGEVTIGNAESADFKKTIIQKKTEVSDRIDSIISEALSEYTLEESDPLTDELAYDVLIIVGEKNEE